MGLYFITKIPRRLLANSPNMTAFSSFAVFQPLRFAEPVEIDGLFERQPGLAQFHLSNPVNLRLEWRSGRKLAITDSDGRRWTSRHFLEKTR